MGGGYWGGGTGGGELGGGGGVMTAAVDKVETTDQALMQVSDVFELHRIGEDLLRQDHRVLRQITRQNL